MSREDALKQAGRLGTDAERIRGEAYKQVQAGGDRKLLLEAERAAAAKISQALDLWRAAGDLDRLLAGAEELSRIYVGLNDYESAIRCLRHESEFWLARGDTFRQVHLIWLIGLRQMQMRRTEAAIKTQEQAVAMSRVADLVSVEINSLETLAMLLEKSGRGAEAEPLRARAKELYPRLSSTSPLAKKQQLPVDLPAQWLDLPAAPLVADYRNVDGIRQAVLVNRANKGIEMVEFGCVRTQGGKVLVVGGLVGVGMNHGGVGPGFYYEPFAVLNGPANRWTDERMGCEGKARMAVIKAVYSDRSEWDAEGTDWKSR